MIKGADYGIDKGEISDLVGGDALSNAKITKEILEGVKGPKRDIVVFNSGCALYARGAADSIEEGIKLAEDSIDSGKALKKLNDLISLSNRSK